MDSSKGFIQIPTKILYDERIGTTAKLLFGIIVDLADENGCAEVTIQRLQKLLHCKSDKTVRLAEAELHNAGYIQVIRTGRASWLWLSTEYQTHRRFSALDWYERGQRRKAK